MGVCLIRLTLGWLRWRFQCDMGKWTPVNRDGPVDWDALGADDYLAWSKKTFGRSWNRMDIDRIFRQDPAWKELVMLGSMNNHYIRVILARAMLSTQDAPVASTGTELSDILDSDGKPTATSEKPWLPESKHYSHSEAGTESLMEGLDRLGENLKRRDASSEN